MKSVIQATTVPSTNGATGGGGEIYKSPAPNYTILLILTAVCGAVIAALCLYGRYSSKA